MGFKVGDRFVYAGNKLGEAQSEAHIGMKGKITEILNDGRQRVRVLFDGNTGTSVSREYNLRLEFNSREDVIFALINKRIDEETFKSEVEKYEKTT